MFQVKDTWQHFKTFRQQERNKCTQHNLRWCRSIADMVGSDALYRMESHYFFSPISGFFFWKENKAKFRRNNKENFMEIILGKAVEIELFSTKLMNYFYQCDWKCGRLRVGSLCPHSGAFYSAAYEACSLTRGYKGIRLLAREYKLCLSIDIFRFMISERTL